MAAKQGKASIQVIGRMVSLLDALARHATPVNLKQLATETKLHPSTAHRILDVMVQNRIVNRIEPGTYGLGMRLLELGTLVRTRLNIRQQALPYMQQLHQQLGESVNLAVRHDDELIYVERTPAGNQTQRSMQGAGTLAPLHITAAGKIFLAADGLEKCREYALRTGLADPTVLLRDIESARQQGYAFDRDEAEKGTSCAGAGIYGGDGFLVAGLSVSAPSERFNKAWAAQVKQMAERISLAIGYQAPGAN